MQKAVVILMIFLLQCTHHLAQHIFFEKFIDFKTGKEDFACNHSLLYQSINELTVELEPYASCRNNTLVINGFSVYLPENIKWKGKKPTLELVTFSGNIIRFKRSIYDKANHEIFFYLTRDTFQQLRIEPIKQLTLLNNNYKLTSKELHTRYEQNYFLDVLDQFVFQIYDDINWLNPYYYDE